MFCTNLGLSGLSNGTPPRTISLAGRSLSGSVVDPDPHPVLNPVLNPHRFGKLDLFPDPQPHQGNKPAPDPQ
jgi:hypothetical protein